MNPESNPGFAAFDHLATMVAIARADGGCIFVNAAFENVFKPAHDLLAQAGITATEVRLVGPVPGDAIAAQATKSKLDLLAMGSLGFGASRHGSMGSVATRVASRCRTALLLVREK